MTEADWLACTDPGRMLDFLRKAGRVSERKQWLFAVACFRRVAHLLPDERCRAAIAIAERFADGQAGLDTLLPAFAAARQALMPLWGIRGRIEETATLSGAVALVFAAGDFQGLPGSLEYAQYARYRSAFLDAGALTWEEEQFALRRSGAMTVDPPPARAAARAAEKAGQVALVRDLFDGVFRGATIEPAWLVWNGGTVAKVARVIYDERRFDDLPILADALEEAGCDEAAILGHCRRNGGHVRGCWALDLLLGKE